jgi:hypothetical protein
VNFRKTRDGIAREAGRSSPTKERRIDGLVANRFAMTWRG